jgi:hypothetical protein
MVQELRMLNLYSELMQWREIKQLIQELLMLRRY